MRTLPSGSRVAVCPERGSSIGAAGFSEPAEEPEMEAAEERGFRKPGDATTKQAVILATKSRRERFMIALLEKSDASGPLQ
jgi:hypothetical protein